MKDKLFKHIFLASMAAFFLALALSIVVSYKFLTLSHWAELEAEAGYLSALIEENGSDFLFGISEDQDFRITLISQTGDVIFDSVGGGKTAEDHSDREEFVEAIKNGTGRSSRYSTTLSEKTTNFAVKLEDGLVLRVSNSQISLFTLARGMLFPFVMSLTFALIFSVFLASRLSKSIVKPIIAIDLDDPDERFVYPEMKPLVEKIEKQNRQIHEQIREIKEAHREQDVMRREFTANVSHELKTPLTAISGSAEIIKNGLVKNEDIPRFAGNIYDEAQRMITLVEDIIKLSQLDENEVPIAKAPLDLLEVAKAAAGRLERAAAKRGITVDVGGDSSTVIGVSTIVDEMIFNLCDNAIKYNRDNGSVEVTVTKSPEKATVSVKDSGIGIPKEELGRVFERFYRVDKSHSRQIGGTGLGLSIVKHAAAFHGAEIGITSEVGSGTEITVTFPLAK